MKITLLEKSTPFMNEDGTFNLEQGMMYGRGMRR